MRITKVPTSVSLLALIFATVFAVGCSGGSGEPIDVKAGMTYKEVEAIMGRPDRVIEVPSSDVVEWHYVCHNKRTYASAEFLVEFGGSGRVESWKTIESNGRWQMGH